jgi:hypothetical protein
MARPQKQTVDYFPHDCNHKRTMFILEERYGNDGYAFWFKLLEMLGNSKGHYLDLNDASSMEFLLAKTHVSEVSGMEMLDLLAKLDAIDPEAWSHKAVWCQNFINGVASVYQSRRQSVPQKPSFTGAKPHGAVVSTTRNHTRDGVSTVDNRQTIVEETIVDKSIYSPIPSESDDKRSARKDIFDHWNEAKIIQHRVLSEKVKRAINGALASYSQDEIVQAIDNYAKILASPAHWFSYKWTLGDFLQRGLDKFIDWRVCDANYKTDGNGKGGGSARALPTEYPPGPVYNRPMLRE